jgi:hypothetical protein
MTSGIIPSMSVCPWCKAAPFDPNAPCRRCGRRAPPVAAVVPDLDFGPPARDQRGVFDALPAGVSPPSQRERSGPESARAPSGRGGPVAPVPPPARQDVALDVQLGGRGAVFEEDDDAIGGGGGISLELDVRGGALRSRAGALAGQGAGGQAPPSQSYGASPVAATSGGPMPLAPPHTPVAPPPNAAQSFRPLPAAVAERGGQEPPVEAFEAKVLARFGEPPKHFWQAPLYAWRVRQRLGELRADLVERQTQADRAGAALEQGLIALGQRARGTAERAPRYGRTLDGIRTHEQTLRQRDGVLMTEMDAHNKRLAVVDQKMAELQAQLSAAQAEERRLSDELTIAQATVERAEAKLKRLDIELRSAFGPPESRRGGS